MNSELALYVAIMAGAVFLSSISQVLLKKSSQEEHANIVSEYLNPKVIVAYILFFVTTLLSIFSYKVVPLSMGPVIEATSYIYITIFGVVIFHEKIGKRKLAGLALIISGLLIYSFIGCK